ncbi:unnamed protein product, partial [Oikopleura dioica]
YFVKFIFFSPILNSVYPLIANRKFQQIDVLENNNLVLSISGKKNKLRCYYLSWLKSKFLNTQPSKQDAAERQGYISVGDLEGCASYKLVKFERIKFLVVAMRNGVDVFAWAPKPYNRFMLYKTFQNLVHRPLIVDLTVEDGTRLKWTFIQLFYHHEFSLKMKDRSESNMLLRYYLHRQNWVRRAQNWVRRIGYVSARFFLKLKVTYSNLKLQRRFQHFSVDYRKFLCW